MHYLIALVPREGELFGFLGQVTDHRRESDHALDAVVVHDNVPDLPVPSARDGSTDRAAAELEPGARVDVLLRHVNLQGELVHEAPPAPGTASLL